MQQVVVDQQIILFRDGESAAISDRGVVPVGEIPQRFIAAKSDRGIRFPGARDDRRVEFGEFVSVIDGEIGREVLRRFLRFLFARIRSRSP